MSDFELHPNLRSKDIVVDLPLCRVLLENQRNYPWIVLVPRRTNISRIMELDLADQFQLIKEVDLAQKSLWNCFHPTQLNVAAIGNKTPQLHIHVIARYDNDPAWPGTVWDHPIREKYNLEEKEYVIGKIRSSLKF